LVCCLVIIGCPSTNSFLLLSYRPPAVRMPTDKRRDPDDGVLYTFQEISSFYAGKFKKQAIQAYWDDECTPVKADPKAKAKAKAKSKPEQKDRGDQKDQPHKKEWVGVPTGLCVCGESLIDFLPCANASGESAFRGVPGGSPFNCCIAAQRLGIPVSYLGALSTDLFGEELFGHLNRENVDTEMVARLPNPTTLAFVSRSAGEGEKYAFFKENAADRQLTKAYVEKSLRNKRFRGVHMSLGAVTLEYGPCAEAFETLFRLGGKMGALRSFDPNLRPNMIKESSTKYSKKIEKLLRVVDLVKTSDDDVEFLYGKDAQIADVCAKWLKLGPKLVIITKGSKGADAYIPQKDAAPFVVEVAPPGERPNTINAEGKGVPVVDSVGAGDTFMGGLIFGCLGADVHDAPLLAQLVEKKAWDDASIELLRTVLRRAATCAAINCSRAGADPPTVAEADKVLSILKK